MKAVLDWIKNREPVAVQGVVVAVIGVGTSFGLDWTGEQVGAVTGLSAVVLGLIARQVVSPTGKPS